jgi:hypothetical protein
MPYKPEIVYFSGVNLSGLISDKPLHGEWDPGTKSYWAPGGNLLASKIGTDMQRGYITFASVEKGHVEDWLKGAKAVMTMLNRWSGGGK